MHEADPQCDSLTSALSDEQYEAFKAIADTDEVRLRTTVFSHFDA